MTEIYEPFIGVDRAFKSSVKNQYLYVIPFLEKQLNMW